MRFAPLQGETFQRLVPAPDREGLPDSLVLRTADGSLLTRSAAIVQLLGLVGGPWGRVAALVGLCPRPVADAVYDAVARVRHRLFARPAEVCPRLPPELRARFDP